MDCSLLGMLILDQNGNLPVVNWIIFSQKMIYHLHFFLGENDLRTVIHVTSRLLSRTLPVLLALVIVEQTPNKVNTGSEKSSPNWPL